MFVSTGSGASILLIIPSRPASKRTASAKYALYLLFQAILNVGDEVIIPVPYWVSYGEQVKLAEGKPVFVSSTQEQSFKVSVAQLEAVRTDKTKAIILNSPSNPTGVIYTEEELRQIGEWAVAHNILIIADRKSTRLNSSHSAKSRMPSSA